MLLDARGDELARVKAALGSPERPLDEAGLERKVTELAGDRAGRGARRSGTSGRRSAEACGPPGLAGARQPEYDRAGRTLPTATEGLMAEEVQIAGSELDREDPQPARGAGAVADHARHLLLLLVVLHQPGDARPRPGARGRTWGRTPPTRSWRSRSAGSSSCRAIVTEWTTSGRIQRSQETVGVERAGQRPGDLHPAVPDLPGGHLVHAERAQQGLAHTAGRRRGQAPSRRRRAQPAPPAESRPEVPGAVAPRRAAAASSAARRQAQPLGHHGARAARGHHRHVLHARALRRAPRAR